MPTLETLLIVFIAVTALAVVIQMVTLIALYGAVRKSASRMEGLSQFAQQLETRMLPTVELAQNMLQDIVLSWISWSTTWPR